MTADEWVEGLLAKLKQASTGNWESGKRTFTAMPATIERAIKEHSQGVDPKLLRSHYERAKSHFDRLIEQADPYAATLRQAAQRLSDLLKRM